MKKLVIICITAVICIAIIAAPIYYQTFFQDTTVTQTPAIQAKLEGDFQNKYIALDDDYDGMRALFLDQETGTVYFVRRFGEEFEIEKKLLLSATTK